MENVVNNRLDPDHVCAPDAERSYIAMLIVDCQRLRDTILQPSDFHEQVHATVFETMQQMMEEGLEPDIATLSDRLQRHPLKYVAWPSTLSGIVAGGYNPFDAPDYERIIRDLAVRRLMLRDAMEDANRALDLSRPVALERAEGGGRYRVHSAAEALEPLPPVEWIVKGLIARGSLSIFYGEPGSKKTYSLLWMATRVAQGEPWLDFSTTRSRALIVDEESGFQRLSLRLRETLGGALASGDIPLSYVSMERFQLNDERDVQALTSLVRQQEAQLVVMDSLAALASGDENSKQDMQPLMNSLRLLGESTGAAVVVIHHSAKTGATYRGSSTFKASADLMVQVTSSNGSPFVNFKTEKNRDGLAASWAGRAVWVGDGKQYYMEPVEARKEENKSQKKLSALQQALLEYLEEHGPSRMAEIRDTAVLRYGCSEKTAQNTLHTLISLGAVRRADIGSRGSAGLYELAAASHSEDAQDENPDSEVPQLPSSLMN